MRRVLKNQTAKVYNGTVDDGSSEQSINELTITTSKEIQDTLEKGDENDLYVKQFEKLSENVKAIQKEKA